MRPSSSDFPLGDRITFTSRYGLKPRRMLGRNLLQNVYRPDRQVLMYTNHDMWLQELVASSYLVGS
jgi:hypothetical protein